MTQELQGRTKFCLSANYLIVSIRPISMHPSCLDQRFVFLGQTRTTCLQNKKQKKTELGQFRTCTIIRPRAKKDSYLRYQLKYGQNR